MVVSSRVMRYYPLCEVATDHSWIPRIRAASTNSGYEPDPKRLSDVGCDKTPNGSLLPEILARWYDTGNLTASLLSDCLKNRSHVLGSGSLRL